MRTFKLALLSLPLLALGCRSNPNEMLLERESRMLEDKIYYLQATLDDCCAAREATIRENEALKKELAGNGKGGGSDYTSPAADLPSSSPRSSSPPSRRPRAKEPDVPLEAPTIELPEPSDTPPPARTGPGASGAAVEGTPTSLVINKRLTGPMDRDGQTGDEGVFLVFEPRDETGRLVKSAGTVSVVVLDPTEQGDQARVARWDFTSDEVPRHFQNTAFGQGMQFELPWPENAPKNRDLQLFVRFTTADGERLNADTKLQLRAPGDPPGVDHQAKTWSATQNATRNNRARSSPSSRLKSQRSAAPRDTSSADNDDPRGSDDQPVREASRNGRPVWTPYR